MKRSGSFEGRRTGLRFKNLKNILRREYRASQVNFTLPGIIIAQVIIEALYLLPAYWESVPPLDSYRLFPQFWALIIVFVFGATSFSSERESRMMDLLQASPIKYKEAIVGKVLYCTAMYFVFVALYLISLVPFAYSLGWVVFASFAPMVLGPYLIIYYVMLFPTVLVSMASRRIVYAVVIAICMYLSVVFLELMLIWYGPKNVDLFSATNNDLTAIPEGAYPNPLLWAVLACFVILMFFSLIGYGKYLWKGAKA